MQWNINKNGQVKGPYSTQDVIAIASGGATDLFVCEVGKSEWVPVAAHPVFSGALRPSEPQGAPATTSGVQYDRVVIMEFAERLYGQADSVTLLHTVLGLGVGLMIGIVIARALDLGFIAVLCCALGGGFGYAIGDRRALMIRVRAQMMLCQLQIEANTRAIAEGRMRMPPPPPARRAV